MRYEKVVIGALTIGSLVCLLGLARKLPAKVYVQGIYALEGEIGELLLPGLTLLGQNQPEKSMTDFVLELTFTPWYYDEARSYIRKNVITQDNEAYLECVIENDSTDYYQLMQEENEFFDEEDTEESSGNVDVDDETVVNGGGKMDVSGEKIDESGANAEKSGQEVVQSGSEVEQNGRNVEENGIISQTPQYQYEEGELDDYEELVKSFYIIDQNTKADSSILNVQNFDGKDFFARKETEEPVIYIYHTHSKEAFCNSREGVIQDTVVGAGEYLTELLTEYGYNVLHDEAVFDGESRDYAYSNALPHLEKVLNEHPTIQVVIDLHRDEMPEETHLVSEVGGKRCARYMFFNGMSYLNGKGEIETLENPNKMDNLAFSFKLQKTSNEYYPGLARRIYLKAYRYNLHLRPASVLIELGAQNNTVEEIMNGCEPLAFVLDQVLSEH